MKTKYSTGALAIVSLLAFCPAFASDYIVPAMVNIPEGSFIMGTNSGDKEAKPAHRVSVEKFQMAKYPVTVAEFRKFVADSNFETETTCKDKLDKNWLSPPTAIGSASWDDNRFLKSEYQPVSCINQREANAYIAWLNKKTGENYRLPTEPEYEYAAKANTTSRYFWGDDPNKTQACLYGNFADQAGEYFASNQYGASYVGFLEYANCNDGEPYISITGLYRPNPFGLYDMLGNINELIGQCYYQGYQARTSEEMDTTQCESIVQRGENWHYPPQAHYTRNYNYRVGLAPSSLTGFRLAKDGHSDTVHASTTQFESALKDAQVDRLNSRPRIPNSPANLQLKTNKTEGYVLSWQPGKDPSILAYEVYQSTSPYSHLLGGFFNDHYELLTVVDASVTALNVQPTKAGQSYRVISKTDKWTSLPSKPVTTTTPQMLTLPGRIEMQESTFLEGALLKHRSKTKEKAELFYISAFNHRHEQRKVTARFNVHVEKSGWYIVRYNGFTVIQDGTFFDIWQGDKFVGNVSYNEEVDDSESVRHKVYLDAGDHNLEISVKREGLELWSLGWVDFIETSA